MSSSLTFFDLVPGKVLLDRYRILRPHRETGMATAFAVEDQEDNSRAEVQVFPSTLFADPEQARGFADKLDAWTDLNYAAVLRTLDVEVLEDGTVLFITEFPTGTSLRGRMSDSARMDPDEVLAISRDLLGGLGEIHAAGLVHGDLKPASIYLRGEGLGAQLVDGGVTPGLWAAKHLGTRTALIGTPFYSPLEQFSGDSPSASADLYGLGTLMYELLTGMMPWQGKGFIEVFQSKMHEGPPAMILRAPGVDVPSDLEQAVAKSMRAKRGERYVSADDFMGALSGL